MAKSPQSQPSPRKNRLDAYGRYSGLGIQMLIIIFAGAYGGLKLDKSLRFKFPLFTIVLSLSAVAVAIWLVVKDFSKKK
jgi:hypothetical protein